MLSSIPPLQDGVVDVSYDIDSLFTNIPVEETINYIIEQICAHKMLVSICSKLIFRRLLIKLAAKCDFKQVNDCTVGVSLSYSSWNLYGQISKFPKRFKRNIINRDPHRSISSNFCEEIHLIKEKFVKADYLLRFINSVSNEFQGDKEYVVCCAIWYHLYNLKNVKNTHGVANFSYSLN